MDRSLSSHAPSSSAGYGAKTSTYRRILISDDSANSSNAESVNGSAFFRDDRSEATPDLNERLGENSTESSDDVHDTDSFVVSDDEYLTDDDSFLSCSDADLWLEGVPSTARRAQPPRRAKGDSREAVLNRAYVMDVSASQREQDVKHSTLLRHGDSTTLGVLKDRDGLSPKLSLSSVQEKREERPSQVDDSDESDVDTDERFESYLKKLRCNTDTKSKRTVCEQTPLSSFIVSDSDVSSPSISESEPSDVSWHPDETCDEGSSSEKEQQINSVKDSLGSLSLFPKKVQEVDQDEYFLVSLSPDYHGKRHPDAERYLRKGVKKKKLRNELTKRLFDIFRTQCFNEELPELFTIKWNPRLLKTAGLCRNKGDRTSWIELSPKVCSTPERIRDTLIHEMCHAAVWIVDGLVKEGHGPIWRKWASRCMQRFRSLPIINRCHDYEIEAKFIYECGGCGQKVRRHTKSLDISRKICGICKCSFTLNTFPRARASPGVGLEQNPFAKFVKENYSKHKKFGMKHGEVMRTLSQLYKSNGSINSIVDAAAPEKELDISVLSIND